MQMKFSIAILLGQDPCPVLWVQAIGGPVEWIQHHVHNACRPPEQPSSLPEICTAQPSPPVGFRVHAYTLPSTGLLPSQGCKRANMGLHEGTKETSIAIRRDQHCYMQR